MVRIILITTVLLLTKHLLLAQYHYEVSPEYPFGQPNPNAPEQIKDYSLMIGICDCKSESRNPDQSWAEPVDMTWRFKYIMNGMAVQDETLKMDGLHSGSIRQYNADSARWYVHYYASSSGANKLGTWEGNLEKNGNIVLYKDQKSPNGADGSFRLTYYDMNNDGYKWVGAWVSLDESIVYPTWKISCKRRK